MNEDTKNLLIRLDTEDKIRKQHCLSLSRPELIKEVLNATEFDSIRFLRKFIWEQGGDSSLLETWLIWKEHLWWEKNSYPYAPSWSSQSHKEEAIKWETCLKRLLWEKTLIKIGLFRFFS
jgi:hypothetical protein